MRRDIKKAMEVCADTMAIRGDIRHLEEYLNEGETVRSLASGLDKKNGWGVLTVTDRPILFVFHGLIHKRQTEVPLEDVKSVGHGEPVPVANKRVEIQAKTDVLRLAVPEADVERIVHDIAQAAHVKPGQRAEMPRAEGPETPQSEGTPELTPLSGRAIVLLFLASFLDRPRTRGVATPPTRPGSKRSWR